MVIRETKTDRLFNYINYILLILILVITCYPIVFVLSASISDPIAVNSGELWLLPKGFNLEGYSRVLEQKSVWTGYRNTIFYTLLGTCINLFVTLTCAFALSRKELPGRKAINLFLTFTMFFSGGIVPTYILIKSLGLINSIWVMVLPGAASMYNIIIATTFFSSTIPNELFEACKVDGSTEFRIFTSVVLPLSAPIIAVMALFYGVGHWNAFFNALLYISKKELYPLQLILRDILIMSQELASSTDLPGSAVQDVEKRAKLAEVMKYALVIITSLPVLIAYPFLQRFFIKGVMIGAIKG